MSDCGKSREILDSKYKQTMFLIEIVRSTKNPRKLNLIFSGSKVETDGNNSKLITREISGKKTP